jgi:transposase
VARPRRWADPLVHANDDAATRARADLVVVCTSQSEARTQVTLKQQVEKAEHTWKQKLWHLSNRYFACFADAQSALARELKGPPVWLEVQSEFVSSEHHTCRGRPRQDAAAVMQWHIKATVTVKQPQVEQEARRKACFIVATNVLDSAVLSEQEVVITYKDQGGGERGFCFLRISLVSGFLRVPQKA